MKNFEPLTLLFGIFVCIFLFRKREESIMYFVKDPSHFGKKKKHSVTVELLKENCAPETTCF